MHFAAWGQAGWSCSSWQTSAARRDALLAALGPAIATAAAVRDERRRRRAGGGDENDAPPPRDPPATFGVPAPAPGSDTLEAKAEAQASMEAWNVSLDELNNPENDEDAVAFEKLMYRMGLAHIKAEDQEAMKPLAVDPTSTSSRMSSRPVVM